MKSPKVKQVTDSGIRGRLTARGSTILEPIRVRNVGRAEGATHFLAPRKRGRPLWPGILGRPHLMQFRSRVRDRSLDGPYTATLGEAARPQAGHVARRAARRRRTSRPAVLGRVGVGRGGCGYRPDRRRWMSERCSCLPRPGAANAQPTRPSRVVPGPERCVWCPRNSGGGDIGWPDDVPTVALEVLSHCASATTYLLQG